MFKLLVTHFFHCKNLEMYRRNCKIGDGDGDNTDTDNDDGDDMVIVLMMALATASMLLMVIMGIDRKWWEMKTIIAECAQ